MCLGRSEELAASIGLTVDELYTFVLQGWFRWDKNADRKICVKKFPEQGGTPAYIWNVIDNKARVPS
jgi:isocitrate lyase